MSNIKRQVFRTGWKVVLGSGSAQERRFVTAVVASAQVGEGGDGGRLVLETSLAHDHPVGAPAAIARPGRAEAAGFRKRQVCVRSRTLQGLPRSG